MDFCASAILIGAIATTIKNQFSIFRSIQLDFIPRMRASFINIHHVIWFLSPTKKIMVIFQDGNLDDRFLLLTCVIWGKKHKGKRRNGSHRTVGFTDESAE